MSATTRRLVVGVVMPLGAVATAVVALGATGDSLPETLATHWDLGGDPNGSTARGPFTALGLALVVAAGVVAAVLVAGRRDPRRGELAPAAATATFVQWLCAGIVVEVLWANAGAAGWRDAARLPVAVAVLVPVIAAGAAAAAARLVAPIGRAPADTGARPRVGASGAGRLVWSADVRAGWPVVGAVASTGLGAAALLAASPMVAVLFLGIAVALGVFAVVGAVVVRGGEGLLLHLRDGKRFVVTVDGAETAAGTINDLVGPCGRLGA